MRRAPFARGDVARAALMVAAVTMLARIVGFVRVLVFARTVGPSCLGDTYLTANTIPNILFDVVAGGALASLAVPLLAGSVERDDGATADRTASALLCWTVVLLVPVALLVAVLASPLVHVLVGDGHPGCPVDSERVVGARMLVVFAPQVVLYGIGIVLTGVLQAHRRFLAPALAPLLSSVVVIATYLWFARAASRRETDLSTLTRGHELLLSVGTTLGVAALTLPLFLPLKATGRRLRATLRFPPGIARSARRLAVAGAIALGAQDVATAAILRLANDNGSAGAVVLYNLAWTVFLLPWAVLAVPIATTAFPSLSAGWSTGDLTRYAVLSARGSRAVIVAMAGAAAIMVSVAAPAARVLVLGAPGRVAPAVLAHGLATFAPALLGFGLVAYLSRVHYSRGAARSAAVATGAGWGLVVAVDVVLVLALPPRWTVPALGIGTTAGMTVAALWLAMSLRRAVGPGALTGTGRTLAAALSAAAVGALAGAGMAAALPQVGAAASVAVTAAVGLVCGVLFLAICTALDRPTVQMLLRRRVADA